MDQTHYSKARNPKSYWLHDAYSDGTDPDEWYHAEYPCSVCGDPIGSDGPFFMGFGHSTVIELWHQRCDPERYWDMGVFRRPREGSPSYSLLQRYTRDGERDTFGEVKVWRTVELGDSGWEPVPQPADPEEDRDAADQ